MRAEDATRRSSGAEADQRHPSSRRHDPGRPEAMLLFLDTADNAQIQYWSTQGIVDGVTTNPTLLRQHNAVDRLGTIAKLAQLVRPGVLHAQVSAVSGASLIDEAIDLSRLAPNIVVKIPIVTPDGVPLLHEVYELVSHGVIVNCTACLSFGQAALAAKAGAQYISILVGRIDDEGGDGAEVISKIRTWLGYWDRKTLIVAGSIRGPSDARRSMIAGANCVTLTPEVLSKLVDHKYSRQTVQEFIRDVGPPEPSRGEERGRPN